MKPMIMPTAVGDPGQLMEQDGRMSSRQREREAEGHVLPPIMAPILTVPRSAAVVWAYYGLSRSDPFH